jgi:hypothetical protein
LGTFSFYLGCGIWEPSRDTNVLLALEGMLAPPSPQKRKGPSGPFLLPAF